MKLWLFVIVLLSAIFTHVLSFARSAVPFNSPAFSMNHLKVGAGKWMSSVTVGFASILSWRPLASEQIYSTSDNLYMPRIHAGGITAYMVSYHLLWNRAKDHCIRITMCAQSFMLHIKMAVPIFIQGIQPIPASRMKINEILALETRF